MEKLLNLIRRALSMPEVKDSKPIITIEKPEMGVLFVNYAGFLTVLPESQNPLHHEEALMKAILWTQLSGYWKEILETYAKDNL